MKHTIQTIRAKKPVSYTRTKPEERSTRIQSFLQYRKTQAKGNTTYVCYIQELPEAQDIHTDEIGEDIP